ncbi:hypothetical protein CH275_12165 [Rhodococcus sp. 06-235-1A]|uniref:hypothetical protein n=1 Tax=Rhodococcus sp. 06-235-1A TaxID=2022508 RepID=UPI000BCE6926|nr:hypothetical protein [Rhodococcus sp. 06-235-1A]OZD05118.1 hypothetical protein CH275_12165 [Rhodococcus sp. 06-235-1A]
MKLAPTLDDAIDIAADVLAKAALLDYRMPRRDDGVTAAWAEIFVDEPIWIKEALEAVAIHYKKPDPTRLMPGTVLAIVAAIPIGPDSSDERVDSWLLGCAQHPYSFAIEEHTGVKTPRWDDTPAGFDTAAAKAWATNGNIVWVREHRDELAQGLRRNGHRFADLHRESRPRGALIER